MGAGLGSGSIDGTLLEHVASRAETDRRAGTFETDDAQGLDIGGEGWGEGIYSHDGNHAAPAGIVEVAAPSR